MTVTLTVTVPFLSLTERLALPTAFAVTWILFPDRTADATWALELVRVKLPETLLTATVDFWPGTIVRELGDTLAARASKATSGKSKTSKASFLGMLTIISPIFFMGRGRLFPQAQCLGRFQKGCETKRCWCLR